MNQADNESAAEHLSKALGNHEEPTKLTKLVAHRNMLSGNLPFFVMKQLRCSKSRLRYNRTINWPKKGRLRPFVLCIATAIILRLFCKANFDNK